MTKETKIRYQLETLVDAAVGAAREHDQRRDLIAERAKSGDLEFSAVHDLVIASRMECIQTENEAVRHALAMILAISDGIDLDEIRIDGWRGKWHVIDIKKYDGRDLALLEHSTYGGETEGLIVDARTHEVILDDVWNGWTDYEDAFCD